MNWYVFSTREEDADESFDAYGSYAEAVKDAQARHQTEGRPKRLREGMYRLQSGIHDGRYCASYIVRNSKMIAYGFGHLLTSERQMKRPNTDGIRRQERRA